MAHKFPPDRWAKLLDDDRRRMLPPGELLEAIGVEAGSVVADLGAGPGYFTFPLAERVGPGGRVYALDVQPEMVEVLRRREPPSNVAVMESGESEFPLESSSVDLAFLAFVLHELADARAFLAEVRRVLRPGGRLAVLEWEPIEEAIGPPLRERLSAEEVERVLGSASFRVTREGRPNSSVFWIVAEPDGDAERRDG